MKALLCLLVATAIPALASEIKAVNDEAPKLLDKDSAAQKMVKDLLHEKLRIDWGLKEEDIEKYTTTLEGAGYSISLPDSEECNPYSEKLLKNDNEYKRKIEKQMKEVADFLADYHFRMLGRNESLLKVRRVAICTASLHYTSPVLQYDRAKSELTLRIGPKRLALVGPTPIRRNNLHPLTAQEIKKGWDEGDHWQKEIGVKEFVDSRKNPIRAYWSFLNPVGEVRTLLRELTRKAGLPSARDIAQLIKDGDIKSLREKIGEKAKDATEANVLKIANRWAEKLASPGSSDSMAMAALSSSLKAAVKRKQIGIVNVENFHQIDISVTSDDVKDFESQINVPTELKVDVTQYGLVNVSTTDQVKVSVALSAMASPAAFLAGTLKSALRELKL